MLTKTQLLTIFHKKLRLLQNHSFFRRLQLLRQYFPSIIIISILIIGLILGKKIALYYRQTTNLPTNELVTPTLTPTPDNQLIPLKQSIIQFNPSLPDPLIPQFDNNITIQQPTN